LGSYGRSISQIVLIDVMEKMILLAALLALIVAASKPWSTPVRGK
jgi:hypothetical protein